MKQTVQEHTRKVNRKNKSGNKRKADRKADRNQNEIKMLLLIKTDMI